MRSATNGTASRGLWGCQHRSNLKVLPLWGDLVTFDIQEDTVDDLPCVMDILRVIIDPVLP